MKKIDKKKKSKGEGINLCFIKVGINVLFSLNVSYMWVVDCPPSYLGIIDVFIWKEHIHLKLSFETC